MASLAALLCSSSKVPSAEPFYGLLMGRAWLAVRTLVLVLCDLGPGLLLPCSLCPTVTAVPTKAAEVGGEVGGAAQMESPQG